MKNEENENEAPTEEEENKEEEELNKELEQQAHILVSDALKKAAESLENT